MSLNPFKKRNFVGIDIGHKQIKMVEVERSGQSWKIVRQVAIPTPSDSIKDGIVVDSDVVGIAIKSAIREYKIAAGTAVIGVSGASVIVRTIKMAKMTPQMLRKSIKYEAGHYVPSSIEDSYIEFEIIGDAEDGQMEVLIVAVPRELVESKKRAVERAGDVVARAGRHRRPRVVGRRRVGAVGQLDAGHAAGSVVVRHGRDAELRQHHVGLIRRARREVRLVLPPHLALGVVHDVARHPPPLRARREDRTVGANHHRAGGVALDRRAGLDAGLVLQDPAEAVEVAHVDLERAVARAATVAVEAMHDAGHGDLGHRCAALVPRAVVAPGRALGGAEEAARIGEEGR